MRTIIIVLSFFIACAILNAVAHEYIHVGAAGLVGIPVDRIDWFNRATLSPTVRFVVTEGSWQLSLVHYAGGIVVGVFWLTAYVFWFRVRGYAERGLTWWLIGLMVAMFAFWQIGQGFLEGAFHDAYIAGAANPLSASGRAQALFMALGLAWHLWTTRLWHRTLLAKRRIDRS